MSGKSFMKLILTLVLLLATAGGGYFMLEDYSASKVREGLERHSELLQVDFQRALINPLDSSLHVWGMDCTFATGAKCSVQKLEVESLDRRHSPPRFFGAGCRAFPSRLNM